MSSIATGSTIPRRASGSFLGLLLPCAIVFASGFCIMLVELVASRLVWPYIGQSLYTWTAVIGVILAGIAIGNYVGGRLADRYDSRRLVPLLFGLSALACFSMLYIVDIIGKATENWTGAQFSARIITVITVSFLLPGSILGTISPAVVKWALDRGYAAGQTVGTIYAWNTIGSIIGTFITGFYLVPAFQLPGMVAISGAGLALVAAALLFAPRGRTSDLPDSSLTARHAAPVSAFEVGRGLFLPGLIVFVSGFFVMVIEIAASRLVADHIGQSLFTWTSVIGVILGGITLGNYLGGVLADNFESKGLVGSLFLIASVLCITVLASHLIVKNAMYTWMGIHTPWGTRVLIVVYAAFFFPATALGTISPAVAKWALDRGYATGRTVGTIYAWNTIGSIAGTFLTGFWLLSMIYISRLLALTTLSLALIAVIFVFSARRWVLGVVSVAWMATAGFVSVFASVPRDRFENTVLAVWPITLEHIHLDEDTKFSKAFAEFDKALVELEVANLDYQAARANLDAALRVRHVDFDAEMAKKDSLLDQAATTLQEEVNGISKQVRAMPEPSDAADATARDVLLSLSDRINDGLGRLSITIRNPERERLSLAAKLVCRLDEINVGDQYDPDGAFEYYDQSNYYSIKVSEDTDTTNLIGDYELDGNGNPVTDSNGDRVLRQRHFRQLVLDALIHGYVDMSDYAYLHYEYEHIYATVSHRLLDEHRRKGEDLRVLFLGGGSYTFPRHLTARYGKGEPGSQGLAKDGIRCDIAEIDPRVTQTVMKSMGLNAANNKTFYIFDDAEAEAESKESADAAKENGAEKSGAEKAKPEEVEAKAPAHEKLPAPRAKAALLAEGLFGRSQPGTRKEFEHKLRAAGAFSAAQLSSSVNYLLDLRTDLSKGAGTIDEAKQLNIEVIGPEKLNELLETTSHENIVTTHGDARQFIMQSKNKGVYDVIYGDAFNDFSVPAHLTTLEFNKEMASLLKPDGIFMANVIDIWPISKFMGAYRNTLRQVFKHVYLLGTDDDTPSDDRSTFILICSQKPLQLDDLGKREGEMPGLKGAVLSDLLMKPVIRGGSVPLGVERFVVGLEQTEFELKAPCVDVGIKIPGNTRYRLSASTTRASNAARVGVDADEPAVVSGDFRIRDGGKTISLEITPKKGDRVYVRGFAENGRDLGSRSFNCNGSMSNFTLPWECARAEVDVVVGKPVYIKDKEYELIDGKKIRFKETLPRGSTIEVTSYGSNEIVLTDAYCPVDNMLADVIATRISD